MDLFRSRVLMLSGAALASLGTGLAVAGPNGGTVVGGGATIQGQGTGSVTINQSTQNTIINWATFNIGKGETTTFNQPNSNSVALNRVIGGQGPSFLDGTLTANGRVFIVNGDGILFGANSSINTAGFLATTNGIRNEDFMAGKYNFNIPGLPNASIVNLGSITATSGGFAALVAPGVRNAGTITATLGTVSLAAGNAFTLDFYGDRLITLAVNDQIAAVVKDVQTGETLKSLVGNSGKLSASGGRVQLTAAAARAVVDSVINNTGVVEADTIGTQNGMIVLGAATGASKPKGAPVQTVKLAGQISAAGKAKGTKGGAVVVTGENIQLSGATIDASGHAGGGKVLIGGDTGGGHPSAAAASIELAKLESFVIPTATTVSVDAASVINASAIAAGNGGKVVLWSDQQTTFAGTILARGGAAGGDGGFVETSSHTLDFTGGRVNTSAPMGTTGTWLLDPTDLTIDAIAASTISTDLATTSVVLQTNVSGPPSGPAGTAGNTSGPGAGDINVNSSINWASNNTLTLSAYRDINIAPAVTIRNGPANVSDTNTSGNLVLRADNTGSGTGAVNFIAIPGINDGPATFGQIDFSHSTGTVSIYYNPTASISAPTVGCVCSFTALPGSKYLDSQDALFAQHVSGQFTAYMLVNNVDDLQNVSTNLSGAYALGRNIDASATAGWNAGSGFIPIGTSYAQFAGIFNGQGYTIASLTINRPDENSIGLFGNVGSTGAIQNVGLIGGSVTGHYAVGALAGSNAGSVTQSYATGAVTGAGAVGGLVGANGGSVSQSYATGTVKAVSGDDVGGLVGFNYHGSITQSFATGAVSGPLDVGGLVGDNSFGTVSQSYATGVVSGTNSEPNFGVGGLVGYMYSGSVTQSYAAGAVNGVSNVGGLVGWNDGSAGSVAQSYALSSVTGTSNVGGLVGYNNASVSQSYATGFVSATDNVGGLVGRNDIRGNVLSSYWDVQTTGKSVTAGVGSSGDGSTFSASGLTSNFMNISNFSGWSFGTTGGTSCANGGACWVIVNGDGSLNNVGAASGATRPFLISEYSTTIANAHQLQLVALDLKASYTLANGIDLGSALSAVGGNYPGMWSTAGFVPIGNISFGFTGKFDGQNHIIDGLAIAPTDPNVNNIGLFGTHYGSVSNLMLTDVSITANPNVGQPSQFVGTVAGQNAGIISNVSVTGSVNGTPNETSLGGIIAGGLVGQNGIFTSNNANEAKGNITSSFANVSVTVGASCVGVSCTGGGQNNAGGLVGTNTTSSIITDSVAIGAVTAGPLSVAGGLVGQNFGTINSSTTPVFTTASTCAQGAAFSCAGGAVSVGTLGQGGGLVGFNDGIIGYVLATGPVTLTGPGGTDSQNNKTQLGGLVGSNQGQIANAFASGNVGSQETQQSFLDAGGLVGHNHGTISHSSATGNVYAGDNSQIGGLTGTNDVGDNNSCGGACFVGIGHNNSATIDNSFAYGSVTAGASSLAGGLSGGGSGATFNTDVAYGNVAGGAGSVLGGLVGGVGAGKGTSLIENSQALGSVTSSGPNSLVGGLVGLNGGSITGSSASGGGVSGTGVTGTSQSYLGGLVAINIGSIIGSSSNSTVMGSGTGNFVGGLVGLNFGTVDPSFAHGNVSSGANGIAGSLVGANGAFLPFNNLPAGVVLPVLPGSFPVGTVSSDSSGTGLVDGTQGPQVGQNYPTAKLILPSFINSCNEAVCFILANGTLFDPNPPLPQQQPPPPPPQNFLQVVTLASLTPGDVVNVQPPDEPAPGPPRSGPGGGPGGLPPEFGSRFFVVPPPTETSVIVGEAVLQIPCNIAPGELALILRRAGVTVLSSQCLGLLGMGSYRVHLDPGRSMGAVFAELARHQIVAGAQANYKYRLTQEAAPDPDLAGLTQGEGDAAQYTISKLGLIDIHRQLKGGNISVAVIDSQIDIKHPDLDGVVAEQFDAVGAPDTPHSHGTGMAGAIFAHRKLMGIAPSARLYAIHAFSSGAASTESTTFNILKGLDWAASKGVRVINMSFAGPRDPSLERALKAAHDKGIVLIAAAGNAGPKSPPLYPGADPNVIAVTATDVNDKLFSGANRGRYIAVAAPGVDILVPAPDNTYQVTTGTSVASAEVSGLAALLLERNPSLGPEDVRKILTSSARRLGTKDRDDDFGSGLIDPSKAIQSAGDLKSPDPTGAARSPAPQALSQSPARPVVPVSHPGATVPRPVR